jgi:uncharacterized protein YegL
MDNGIFVSHSTADHEWCIELVRVLKAAGYDVWYDSTSLRAGESWIETIEHEIMQRELFILIDSPAALDSRWVRDEINLALNTNRRIIRLIHLPTSRSGFITTRQGLDVVGLAGDTAAERVLPHLNAGSGIKAVPSPATGSNSPAAIGKSFAYGQAPYGQSGRSLPIYLLLDCSESMSGAPIEALRQGMQMLYDELMDDPETRSKVKISVITFNDIAMQTDLVPIKSFIAPILTASGARRLDGALLLLAESIEHDVRLNTSTQRGDYCPLVFLLTDGPSSYPIEKPLARLRALRYNHKPMIIALGAGPDVDEAELRRITDNVLFAADISGEKLREYFQFISGSVQSSSRR